MIDEALMNGSETVFAVKGFVIGNSNPEHFYFTNVCTDSREVVKNTLFVPLVGEFQNGHKYIPQGIEKGASVVLLNKDEYDGNKEFYDNLANNNETLFIAVKNTMKALQDAAEFYVEKFPSLEKIAITGSCGKTTTKELLVSIFSQKYNVVATKGNFNSETGLPLSVFQIRKEHQVGIFEMGMNRVNEIEEIVRVLKPKYAIITNIGTAHIGILGSRANIATEKRKIFSFIPENGAAFILSEDDFKSFISEGVKGKIIEYGKSISSEVSGVQFVKDDGMFGCDFKYQNENIHLNLSGTHNYVNALGAIAIAKEFEISAKEIKKGVEQLKSLNGRMEIDCIALDGKKINFIKDFYNANLDSMVKSIQFLKNLEVEGNKFVVLADMKELGPESKKMHESVGNEISNSMLDYCILVGPEMKAAYKIVNGNKSIKSFYFEDNSNEAFEKIIELLRKNSCSGDTVLLKGSHSMSLEKTITLIEKI